MNTLTALEKFYYENAGYSYDPAKAFEWDRPEVFAVMDGDGDLWARGSGGWWCVTHDGYDVFTTQELAQTLPITVHAVLAEET